VSHFSEWQELRNLVKEVAKKEGLSPESELMALDSAFRAPVHAYACYQAIMRSYE